MFCRHAPGMLAMVYSCYVNRRQNGALSSALGCCSHPSALAGGVLSGEALAWPAWDCCLHVAAVGLHPVTRQLVETHHKSS